MPYLAFGLIRASAVFRQISSMKDVRKHMMPRPHDAVRRVWMLQAAYFIITGIWPLVGIRTFQWITGPKTDFWLVRCVGALVAVVGVVLGMAGRRGRITPEITTLAVGSSASLATIDTIYSARGRISRIYLLDAVINALFIIAWVRGRRKGLWRTPAS